MDISHAPPSRRSPLSFLSSLLCSSQPAQSFVPALPNADSSTTPAPLTKSFFTRAFRKYPSHPPRSDPSSHLQRSFFNYNRKPVDAFLSRPSFSPRAVSVE